MVKIKFILSLAVSFIAVVGLTFLYGKFESRSVSGIQDNEISRKQAEDFALANVKTVDGTVVDPHLLKPSESCLSCHSNVYEEWKISAHARSAVNDPIYEGHEETFAIPELGEDAIQFCAACHTPEAHVTGSIGKKKWTDRKYEEAGTSCIICHAITDVQDTNIFDGPGNASYVFAPESIQDYPFENTEALYGLRDFILRGAPQQHVEDYSRPLYNDGKYCATCHSQSSPDGFIEQDTYREWEQSIYAKEDSPEFKTCITCHMAAVPGKPDEKVAGQTTDRGKVKDSVTSHLFVGANQALPYLHGDAEMFALTEQMLSSAATIEIIDTKQAKGSLDFKVKVTNVGAGHNLPTGATDLRQLWLDIEVLDDSGRTIFTSGKLDDKLEIEPNSTIFHSKFYDEDDNLITHHQVWKVVRKEDNLIPPKGSKYGEYSVTLPEGIKKATVHAKLRYRVSPQYFADVTLRKFGGPGTDRTLPITDVALDKRVIHIE